ncbi:MAG TPA: AMP-binding protein [Gammaproteobacteria bacterium]
MNTINDFTIVGLTKNNSVDFVEKLFQLYTSGKIVVFLDDVTSDMCDEIRLNEIIETGADSGWLEAEYAPVTGNKPAQIVYSSGTEGKPKALLLSHRALSDVVTRLNSVMQVDESIREYIGVPVTYSFGLGRCRAVASAGGKCFIPANGFNPTEIKAMLDTDEINAISAVPSLWRIILQSPQSIGNSGKKVKWIEIGSQYMSRSEKEQMKAIFPNARIVQHYGLTEASRTTFLDISSTQGEHLESVGKPYGDVEVAINQQNRIKIRGPHVADGIIINGEITPVTDSDGWLTTSDNGHIIDGYLYYDGRADDLINLAGVKINPDRIQSSIDHETGSAGKIAVCRISDPLRGDGIFIAVEKNAGFGLDEIRQIADSQLSSMGINAGSSLYVQYVTAIPKTTTGKVQRKQLAELFLQDTSAPTSVKTDSKDVYGIFNRIFPRHKINSNSTFKSLGGDSLNYVQLTMMLEKYLGQLPPQWDTLSISELESSKENVNSSLSRIEISSLLRAIAILFIVGTHTGMEVLGGGTLLLIFLVGYNFARFKSHDIINNNIWQPLWSYIRLVLIPYYLLAAVYLAWNRTFEIDVLLLYANLIEAKITVIFPFWFVQVLVQCLLLIALLFMIPWCRKALRDNAWSFSVTMLVILITIRALYPYVWDTSHLNNLVPLRFMAIIWLGWCFAFADTAARKTLLVIASCSFALIDTGLKTQTAWLVLGSLAMAYVPYILAPRSLSLVTQLLASATFYIFVFNGIFIYIVVQVLDIESYLIAFIAGLAPSMIIWWATEYIYINDRFSWLNRLKYSRHN